MPETETDRGAESREGSREASPSGSDQSNRSERPELGSAPSGSDARGFGDQTADGGASSPGQTSAEFGPNGADSRTLSSPEAPAQGTSDSSSPDGRPSLGSPVDQAAATKPEADLTPASQADATASTVSDQDAKAGDAQPSAGDVKQNANMSVERNYTPGPKAEDNMSHGPKADAPKADGPKADAPKADAPKADAPKADAPKQDGTKGDGKQDIKDVNPQTLTKEQIDDILKNSKGLDDAKLNLGLGPCTDQVLADYLIAHGYGSSPAQPSAPQPQYDGPSIGPDRGGISYAQQQANQKAALEALDAERHSVLAAVGGGIAAARGGDGQDINRAAQAGKAAGDLWGQTGKAGTAPTPTATPGPPARRRASSPTSGARGYDGGPGRPSNWITANTSSSAPRPISPRRAGRIRKWPLIPTRNSTVARNTVSRMYLSDVEPASAPSAKAASACMS